MTHQDKLAIARRIIAKKAPYFMHLVYGLIPIPDDGVPTAATAQNMVMRYNPEYIERQTAQAVAGLIVHEASHVGREHHKRFAHLATADERLIANLAMDLAINPDLVKSSWELPKDGVFPAQFGLKDGLTSEEYYALLEKLQKQSAKGGEGSGAVPLLGPNRTPGVCAGSCGSAATGGEEDKEAGKKDGGDGRTEEEIASILLRTAEATRDHIATQGRGSVPRFLQELMDQILQPPKIHWSKELAYILRRLTGRIKSGGADYSLRRPSKRSMIRGIIRPGLVSYMPEVAFIRDTSGSMGSKQIVDATSESCGVFRSLGLDHAWYIDADTRAAAAKRVRMLDIPKLPITGRGGTDFTQPLQFALKLKPKPDIIIYLTDGDGSVHMPAPLDTSIVWCVVNSYHNKPPVPWGHYVQLT